MTTDDADPEICWRIDVATLQIWHSTAFEAVRRSQIKLRAQKSVLTHKAALRDLSPEKVNSLICLWNVYWVDNYWSGLFQLAAFHLNDFRLNSLDNFDGLNLFVVAFVVFGWSLTLVRNAFIVVCVCFEVLFS